MHGARRRKRPRPERRQAAVHTRVLRPLPLVVVAVGLSFALSALSAANTVTAPRLGTQTRSISANDLGLALCGNLGLTSKVVGGNGGNGNDLVIGTAGNDTITGGNGTDCILAGGGDDTLGGGNGPDDVCHGGAGVDTYRPIINHGCETSIEIP